MKPSRNDVTGDFIITSASNFAYRTGWDLIFGKKEKEVPVLPTEPDTSEEPKDEST